MKKLLALSVLVLLLTGFTTPYLKTSLTVTVRDEKGNIVPDANIKLYSNRENWEKEIGHFAEMFTDDKGVAKFKDVSSLNIYILVRKGDLDNTGGGEMTRLEDGKFNKITVIIN
jgi:hypothetical protein